MAEFGHHVAEAFAYWLGGNEVYGTKFMSPADVDTVNFLAFSGRCGGGGGSAKGLIVKASDLTIVANAIGDPVVLAGAQAWHSSPFSILPVLAPLTDYYLMVISNCGPGDFAVFYHAGGVNQSGIDAVNSYAAPADLGVLTTEYNVEDSIYVDYNVGGATPQLRASIASKLIAARLIR